MENAVLKKCILSSFLNMAGLAAARMLISYNETTKLTSIATYLNRQVLCNAPHKNVIKET